VITNLRGRRRGGDSAAASGGGGDPALALLPLLEFPTDYTYQGCFKLTNGNSSPWLGSFDPTGNAGAGSLFSFHRLIFSSGLGRFVHLVAEHSIPASLTNPYVSMAATVSATQLQAAAPVVDDLHTQICNPVTTAGDTYIAGVLPYDGELLVTGYVVYEKANVATHGLLAGSRTVSGWAAAEHGPYKIGALEPAYSAGNMILVPEDWQDALGGTVMSSLFQMSVTSRSSQGPTAFFWYPEDLSGAGGTIPAQAGLYYPYSDPVPGGSWPPMGAWASSTRESATPGYDPNDVGIPYPLPETSPGSGITGSGKSNVYGSDYTGNTLRGGALFASGTRTVSFFCAQGTGEWCYKHCLDHPVNTGTMPGQHAEPYVYRIYDYDAWEMAQAVALDLNPFDLLPYRIYDFSGFPSSPGNGLAPDDPGGSGGNVIRGVAHDQANKRVFIAQAMAGSSGSLIHVYTHV
jgi:hypothetical protein